MNMMSMNMMNMNMMNMMRVFFKKRPIYEYDKKFGTSRSCSMTSTENSNKYQTTVKKNRWYFEKIFLEKSLSSRGIISEVIRVIFVYTSRIALGDNCLSFEAG